LTRHYDWPHLVEFGEILARLVIEAVAASITGTKNKALDAPG